MSINRRSKFAALALGLTLVTAACSSDSKDEVSSSSEVSTASTAATGDTTAETTDETTGDTTGDTTTEETTGDTTADTATEETTGDTAAEGASGGTATYAAEQEYTSFNNLTADQVLFANTLVLNVVQPGPFISNPDLSLTLDEALMESVEVTSEDPQVVEYVISPDAVWSDGEPIDCDDFYLSWLAQNGAAGNQLADDGTEALDDDGNPIPVFNAAGTTGYEDISTVDCSDDGKTVTTTYSTTYVDYQALFGTLLPAHVVEAKAGVEDLTTATDPADLAALGDVWSNGFIGFDPEMDLSGLQYTIDSFTPGETLILKRNEAYYGTPGKLDEIVFRLVADATEQPTALENGDVQVISPQPNPDLLAQLQGISGVTTEVDQGVTFEHYDFNQANKFLADVNVRKAIALCIDRQEIVDTLIAPLNPDATVLNNRMYVPGGEYYQDNSGGTYETLDVDGAKALLEESGYVLGDDGYYALDGEQLTIRLGRRDPNPRRQSENELAIASCKEAGINLTDDPSEDFNAVRLPASDYDIALFAWVATAFQSSNASLYLPVESNGGQNWNNYNNDALIPLFEAANKDFDPETRAATMNEIDAILWDDMVTLPLFQYQELIAYSDTVTGVSYNGPLGVTWDAQNWAVAE